MQFEEQTSIQAIEMDIITGVLLIGLIQIFMLTRAARRVEVSVRASINYELRNNTATYLGQMFTSNDYRGRTLTRLGGSKGYVSTKQAIKLVNSRSEGTEAYADRTAVWELLSSLNSLAVGTQMEIYDVEMVFEQAGPQILELHRVAKNCIDEFEETRKGEFEPLTEMVETLVGLSNQKALDGMKGFPSMNLTGRGVAQAAH